QVLAFAAGGYVAGRVRNSWGSVVAHERRFRDGMHGLVVWAVALLVGALLAASAAASLVKTGTDAAASIASGAAAGGAASAANGGQRATAPADYAFDYLMRPVPATANGTPAGPTAAGTAPAVYRMPTAQELQPSIAGIFGDALAAGTLPAA